jgi:hypothetical protein
VSREYLRFAAVTLLTALATAPACGDTEAASAASVGPVVPPLRPSPEQQASASAPTTLAAGGRVVLGEGTLSVSGGTIKVKLGPNGYAIFQLR